MDRKQEQAELIFLLGKLFGPLIEMSDNPGNFEAWERTRTLARFSANHPAFCQSVNKFLTSEPGHTYQIEMTKFSPLINLMMNAINIAQDDNEKFKEAVTDTRDKMLEIILSIPIPTSSQILDAYTPFTTYCFVKDKCVTASNSIIWVDRYFDPSIFYRYLRGVPGSSSVSLVTWPVERLRVTREKEKFVEFVDVFKLYQKERDNKNTLLIFNENIHDRWLMIDKHIFNLGGSVKDASHKDYFTVSTIDPTEENFNKVKSLVENGVEFGG